MRYRFLLLFGHLLGRSDLGRAELADGKQFFNHDALGNNRLELVINQVDRVDLLARVTINDGVCNVVDLLNIEVMKKIWVRCGDFDRLRTVTHNLMVRC